MKNNSIGIDISDSTIEVVELMVQGNTISVKAAGNALLAHGIVENGRIKNAELLTTALHEVLAAAHPSPIKGGSIVFGLPEDQVYTYVFDLGPHAEAERDEQVRKEAYANIPLDERELTFSYSVLREDASGARILLVATSKETFGEWLAFFEQAGFEVAFFDVETLATFRSIFKKRPTEPICMVDVGAAATVITIFNRDGLQYVYSLKIAGNVMTTAVAGALKISEKEAEERKISMGMLGQEGKLFSVLEKSFQPVIDSIRSSLTGFQKQFGQELNEIILIGGGSKVNGLAPYVQAQFTQTVKEGVSFIQGEHVSLRHIEAIGLALRGLEREEDQKDPVMLSKAAISGAASTTVPTQEQSEKKNQKIMPAEAVMATPHEIVTIRKFRFEKRIFIMILVVGIELVVFAKLLREYERAQQNSRFPTNTSSTGSPVQGEKRIQSFPVQVPVALSEASDNHEVIRARIASDVVKLIKGEGEDKIVARSLESVRSHLAPEETMWPVPLPMALEKKSVQTGSRTFQWFIYNETQANNSLIKELERVSNLHDYSLREIEKLTLVPTTDPLLFYLTGKITVFANLIGQPSQ